MHQQFLAPFWAQLWLVPFFVSMLKNSRLPCQVPANRLRQANMPASRLSAPLPRLSKPARAKAQAAGQNLPVRMVIP